MKSIYPSLSLSLSLSALLLISCTGTKKTVSNDVELPRYVELPELTITSGEETHETEYHPSVERVWDLIHTKLDIAFNRKEESVYGSAQLSLTPVFYDQDTLKLNAVNMQFSSIKVNGNTISNFAYDKEILTIPVGITITSKDKIVVDIQYKAFPRSGGADMMVAIQNDKGFYFIDPLDTVPDMPFQVWTQGETSGSRKWFPTLDQPNEKHTQEISITLPDSLQTISNGMLVGSTKDNLGNRKDTWKLDIPHAVYLTMVAAGQWDRASETWNGKPLDYYVPPGYGESAKAIFANTPEMLDFFTEKFGYPFVWPKYTQVVVNEFVSGAMENTTAVTFGDFILFHDDDQIETGLNDYIVAHELSHHWFGDLVTCESWANLTLNEGFANYSEYLWFEHKYGKERASIARKEELDAYLEEADLQAHPLIYYHYPNEVSMFDAHSYNKGGLVLHMLRNLVGDDAFFASLKEYLTTYAYSTTEVADLRQSFEKITGKDLKWFFSQWYDGIGHPELMISSDYNQSKGAISLSVAQTQQERGFTPTFSFPLEVGIIQADSSFVVKEVWVDAMEQEITIPNASKPLAVLIDPNGVLLSKVEYDEQDYNAAVQLLKAPSIITRMNAIVALNGIPDELKGKLMNDTSVIMQTALIEKMHLDQDMDGLLKMADRVTNPGIQLELMGAIASIQGDKAIPLAGKIISSNPKPAILAPALLLKGQIDPAGALAVIEAQKKPLPSSMYITKLQLLNGSEQLREEHFTSEEARQSSVNDLETLIYLYTTYLSTRSESEQTEGLNRIGSTFYTSGNNGMLKRFSVIYGLVLKYNEEPASPFRRKIVSTIKAIYNLEPDENVRSSIREGLDGLWNEDRT